VTERCSRLRGQAVATERVYLPPTLRAEHMP
jgi:hypothetical protein